MAVETSQSEPKQQRGLLSKALPALPYVLGGVVLIGYFVWMFSEMSSQAPGGTAVPLSIFGAVLLGVIAGGASMLSSRRQK
jgi:asparagine N-glycosylation enzyme membrane subunit Stt3